MARGLLASDDEWNRCLSEAAAFQMPRQMRETFAFICIFGEVTDALKLWTDHLPHFIMDYHRNYSEAEAINKALHDLEAVFKQHVKTCAAYQLPSPIGVYVEQDQFDTLSELAEAERRIRLLNRQQKAAFDKIMAAAENVNAEKRCFYLDGPGGSGKTFLYETLMKKFRGNEKKVFAFATTGIASTLLQAVEPVTAALSSQYLYWKHLYPVYDLLPLKRKH